MIHLAFADKLGPALYAEYLSNGTAPFALYLLAPNTGSQWFVELGDSAVTGRDALAGAALDEGAKDLVKRLGSDPAKWRWGDLHTISFEHPLSAAKPLDLVLTVGPVRRAGDGYSPNNGAYSLVTPFGLRSHPSERMIVDLGDLDGSRAVLPTGESGQPLSKHWGDQTPLWLRGDLHPMWFTRGRIESSDTLVLRAR